MSSSQVSRRRGRQIAGVARVEIPDERILDNANVSAGGEWALTTNQPDIIGTNKAAVQLHAVSQRKAEIAGTTIDYTIAHTSHRLVHVLVGMNVLGWSEAQQSARAAERQN